MAIAHNQAYPAAAMDIPPAIMVIVFILFVGVGMIVWEEWRKHG